MEVTGHRGGTEGSQGHLRRCWFLSCRGPELPPGARTALSSRTPVSPSPPSPTLAAGATDMARHCGFNEGRSARHSSRRGRRQGRCGCEPPAPAPGGGTQAGGRGGAGRGWGCREVQGPEHAGARSQRGERPVGTERRQPSVPLTVCPWRGPGFPGRRQPLDFSAHRGAQEAWAPAGLLHTALPPARSAPTSASRPRDLACHAPLPSGESPPAERPPGPLHTPHSLRGPDSATLSGFPSNVLGEDAGPPGQGLGCRTLCRAPRRC